MTIKELNERLQKLLAVDDCDDVTVVVEYVDESGVCRMGVLDTSFITHDVEEKPNYYYILLHSERMHRKDDCDEKMRI